MNTSITVRISPELAAQLAEVANQFGATRSAIVTDLLEVHLGTWEPAGQNPAPSRIEKLEGAIETLQQELSELSECVDRLKQRDDVGQSGTVAQDNAGHGGTAKQDDAGQRGTASPTPKTLIRAGEPLPSDPDAQPLTYAGKLTQKQALAALGIARRTARDRAERSGLTLADWLEANSGYRRDGKYWVLGQQG